MAKQPIASAPRDGTVVRVWHGPKQQSCTAYWSKLHQCWVESEKGAPYVIDKLVHPLHTVEWWDRERT